MRKEIKFNKENYLQDLNNVTKGTNNLNEFVQTIINMFNIKSITDELIINIKENPIDVFKKEVENRIPETLRNANFSFKLDYLGLTNQYNTIVQFFETKKGTWIHYSFDLKDNQFFISENTINKIKELHTIYIETESDIKKYEFFEKLKNLLNEGFENEMLNLYLRPQIIKNFKEFNLEVLENKNNYEIVINPYSIKNEF